MEFEREMSGLDSVLKNSLAKASTHSKTVYSQNPLTASEVLELATSRVLTIAATVKPNNRPHLSPTDLVVVNNTFYLGVDRVTARYRNLSQNSAVAVMLADVWKRQAILEGTAEFIDINGETAEEILAAQNKKSMAGSPMPLLSSR